MEIQNMTLPEFLHRWRLGMAMATMPEWEQILELACEAEELREKIEEMKKLKNVG